MKLPFNSGQPEDHNLPKEEKMLPSLHLFSDRPSNHAEFTDIKFLTILHEAEKKPASRLRLLRALEKPL